MYNHKLFPYYFRVTEHLLAMSRPSTEIIEKYQIISQFRRYGTVLAKQYCSCGGESGKDFHVLVHVCLSRNGIKTVINLQIPGEHADCGNALEPKSGFSYNPEVFMENNSMFFKNNIPEIFGLSRDLD